MGVKLLQKAWDEIELKYFEGRSALSLANEYGVSEGAVRKRLKGKKQDRVEDAATKVVQARMAVAALPEALRVQVDELADTRMRITESMCRSSELAAKTAHRLTHIANLQASKLDEEKIDTESVKLVHGLMETANKAAYQPIELLKASKGTEQPPEAPPPTIDVTKLSSATRRELLESRV